MKKISGVTLIVVVIFIGWYLFYKKNNNPINFSCKFGKSCEFCKNGSYTEWDPMISDGAITYYDSNRTVLAVVGGMKVEGNSIVRKFREECQEVK